MIKNVCWRELNDTETDRAYIAGLFDGEGSIHFKRGIEKKKKHKGKVIVFPIHAYQYGNNYDRLFCIMGSRNAGFGTLDLK